MKNKIINVYVIVFGIRSILIFCIKNTDTVIVKIANFKMLGNASLSLQMVKFKCSELKFNIMK